MRVRDGSLLSARYPTAVCNANIITTQRITDVLLGALAPVIPERVIAACSGTMNLLNIGGIDPRNGIYYNFVETYAGGQGAMHDADGMDAVQNHMTNTRNAPVESSSWPIPCWWSPTAWCRTPKARAAVAEDWAYSAACA